MVMATYPLIASEFNDLANASWLITSHSLAAAATQPLVSANLQLSNYPSLTNVQYGKLSDIYGRKPSVIVAYVLFAIGT